MGKTSSKLSPEEMDDLTRNTHFNEKELTKWYKGFIKDFPGGYLDKEEFVTLYSRFYKSGNARRFAEHVFRAFDINNDDKIGK